MHLELVPEWRDEFSERVTVSVARPGQQLLGHLGLPVVRSAPLRPQPRPEIAGRRLASFPGPRGLDE